MPKESRIVGFVGRVKAVQVSSSHRAPRLSGVDLDAVGALLMAAERAAGADDQHGTTVAAARLVGRHSGL
jgi:hypothetical protein